MPETSPSGRITSFCGSDPEGFEARYYDPVTPGDAVLSARDKEFSFAYQREYRFLWDPPFNQRVARDLEPIDLCSNAGVLLAAKVERRLGLCSRLAAVLRDRRDPAYVKHSLEDQMRQRVLQIACGYEDCNDASELREEPAFLTAMGRMAGGEEADLGATPSNICSGKNGREL